MKNEDFETFSNLVMKRSGLVLTSDKAYLLETRLSPVSRKWGLASLSDMAQMLRLRPDEAMVMEIVEAMTTNESSFFRDTKPFDLFKNTVLPHFAENRGAKKHLRIWSAASSSGQEAYSLAMLLEEERAKMPGWTFEIIGTDLSSEMVERAKAGIYSQFEVQRGLPITMLVKYFKQQGDKWQINEKIRAACKFRTYNLLSDLTALGQFDVVFCRNVLIYFDAPTKGRVLAAIARQMPSDGMLFLGGAETVIGVTDKFKPLEHNRGIYVLGATGAAFGLQQARA